MHGFKRDFIKPLDIKNSLKRETFRWGDTGQTIVTLTAGIASWFQPSAAQVL
jgi:hypothetical protein